MSVITPDLSTSPGEQFGPARIVHWSHGAGLDQLGTYMMTFESDGEAAPWTLAYEESILLLEGEAWIVDVSGSVEIETRLEVGELVVIQKGTTVRYGGEEGARLLLSIAPVRWQS